MDTGVASEDLVRLTQNELPPIDLVQQQGGVHLTEEEVNMLVQALSSKDQLPKGRRKWFITRMLRRPDVQVAKPAVNSGPETSAAATDAEEGCANDICAAARVRIFAENMDAEGVTHCTLLQRVGIVGCGEIAESYAACLTKRGGKVVCVFDQSQARATRFGTQWGSRVAESLSRLLADDRVGIVLNLSPSKEHFAISLAALEAGRHVWSEKPLALSLVDARTLERAAAARGLQIGCSPLSFWGEAQQSLARRIRAGAIGTVRSVSVELFCGAAENAEWNGGDARTFNHSGWSCHSRMGAGSMSDVGVYALAVITALLGPVQAATAHKHDEDSRLGAGEGVTRIDLYEVHLVLAGGVTARVVTSFSIAADRKRSITLHGDDGSLTLDTLWDFDSPVSILPLGARAREVLAPMRPPFERCAPHAHVCDWSRSAPSLERVLTAAVRQARRANFQLAITGRRVSSGLALLAASVGAGGDRAFTGDHAAHLVEVLEAIEASASSRQEVQISSTFSPVVMLASTLVPRFTLSRVASDTGYAKTMSRLVLGTSDLASAKSPTTILDAAWALGITTFDVAPVYGKNGAAETALGSWLALRRIPREDVVLVGKAGHPTRNGGARLSSAELEEDVVTSLERLRTNFLDILLAHRDNEDLPVANIVEAMHALIESGRIHRWGTSNWSPPRIAAAVAAARANGWATPTVDAAQFSLAIPAIPVWPGTTAVEGDHLELYEREGIQPIVWAPLANGFLAGRWEEADRTRFPNTHYGEGRMIAAFVTPLNLERRTRLRALAAELRVTPAQAAVGFLLAHPCSPAITIGTTSVAHLQELVSPDRILNQLPDYLPIRVPACTDLPRSSLK